MFAITVKQTIWPTICQPPNPCQWCLCNVTRSDPTSLVVLSAKHQLMSCHSIAYRWHLHHVQMAGIFSGKATVSSWYVFDRTSNAHCLFFLSLSSSILVAVLRVVVNRWQVLAHVWKTSVPHRSLNVQEQTVTACTMRTSSVTGWQSSIKTINSKYLVKKHWNRAIIETRSVAVRSVWRLSRTRVKRQGLKMATITWDKH